MTRKRVPVVGKKKSHKEIKTQLRVMICGPMIFLGERRPVRLLQISLEQEDI